MARRPNDPQRRERILQATLDTIAAHGIHAVTHRKIATCANVPLGSLTYYFSGIEALIEEAFSLFTAEMSAQYQQGFVGVTNREQACDAIADLIFSEPDEPVRNERGVRRVCFDVSGVRPAHDDADPGVRWPGFF